MSAFQKGLKDGFPTSLIEGSKEYSKTIVNVCKCEDACACSDVMQRVTGFQICLRIVCKSGQFLSLSLKTYIVNA